MNGVCFWIGRRWLRRKQEWLPGFQLKRRDQSLVSWHLVVCFLRHWRKSFRPFAFWLHFPVPFSYTSPEWKKNKNKKNPALPTVPTQAPQPPPTSCSVQAVPSTKILSSVSLGPNLIHPSGPQANDTSSRSLLCSPQWEALALSSKWLCFGAVFGSDQPSSYNTVIWVRSWLFTFVPSVPSIVYT